MATKVSALRSAIRKDAGTVSGPQKDVVLASDCHDLSSPNSVLYTRDQVVEAIEGYVQGDTLEKQGDGLMKLHRPTIEAFGINNWASRWVAQGIYPEASKLRTTDDINGDMITFMLSDKSVNINEQEIAALSNLIGAKAAEANLIKRDSISFNQEKLEQQVDVKVGAKTETKTVIELIDEAISEKFEKIGRTDVLNGLFEIKEVSMTRKGLLPKGLSLIGGPGPLAAGKLVEFIRKAKAVISCRPGASGK